MWVPKLIFRHLFLWIKFIRDRKTKNTKEEERWKFYIIFLYMDLLGG